MSFAVECAVMHLSHALSSTPAARASESNTTMGVLASAHLGCDWKSELWSSQNFPCTPAHIAASAAICAFL